MPYLAAQAKGILYWPSRWHVCLAVFSTFWTVCGSRTQKKKKQEKQDNNKTTSIHNEAKL